jgi:hypothetical protein
MQSQRLPSFFLIKRIGTPYKELVGLMKPLLTLSSMKVWRRPNSNGEREYMHPGEGA